jgi:exosortase
VAGNSISHLYGPAAVSNANGHVRVATGMSTYILQTVGMPAVAEGNVIILDDVRLGVVDACSGLGMIVTFAAMSAGVALIIRSEWWVKVGVLFGAIPLAVVSNVARITVTGVLYQAGFAEVGEAVFHDLAGWLMMPLASVILIGEVYVLDRLVIDAPPIADRIVRIDGAAAPA